MILAGNPGGGEGRDYSFIDSYFDAGSDVLFYFLELLDLSGGIEIYGPVEVKLAYRDNLGFSYKLYVPIIER